MRFCSDKWGLKEMLLAGETNVLLLLLVCTLFPLLLL